MSWADKYIVQLKSGQSVKFRPIGESMKGRIESGQLVTVNPYDGTSAVPIDTIVLCTVRSTHYLHLIKDACDDQFLIGNNRGKINGWIAKSQIHGLCSAVEP